MNQEREPKGGKRLQKGTKKPSKATAKTAKPGKTAVAEKPFYKRPLFLVLAVLAVVVVGLFIFWNIFSAPPPVEVPERPSRAPIYTTAVDPNTGKETTVPVEVPDNFSDLKKEYYTFLLIGQDTYGGGNTDTMMLCSYDVPNQKLNVMSLPRDTLIDYNGTQVMLNSVYNRAGGKKNYEKAIEALTVEVGQLTGVYPNFHVIVQWDAFGELVDAIDGVDFDVPRNMKYDDPTQNLHIRQAKGFRHLSGNDAMQVIRWRHNNDGSGYPNADLGRVQTQQALMKAIIAKCLDPSVLLSNLGEYITIFQKNVQTNLSVSNMTYFGKSAISGLSMDNVVFATMPCKASNARVVPAGKELLELVNERFNPYVEPLQLEELDIQGGATSNYISGGLTDITSPAGESQSPASSNPATSSKPTISSESVTAPTIKPTAKATPEPTTKPTAKATPKPTAKPAAKATPKPTAKPATKATPKPTVKPTAKPTTKPVSTPNPTKGPAESVPPTNVSEHPAVTPAPQESNHSIATPKPVESQAPSVPGEPSKAPVETVAPTPAEQTPAPVITQEPPAPTPEPNPTVAPPDEPIAPPGE